MAALAVAGMAAIQATAAVASRTPECKTVEQALPAVGTITLTTTMADMAAVALLTVEAEAAADTLVVAVLAGLTRALAAAAVLFLQELIKAIKVPAITGLALSLLQGYKEKTNGY